MLNALLSLRKENDMVIAIIPLIIFILSMLIFTFQFICLAEFDKKNKFIEFVVRFVNKNSFKAISHIDTQSLSKNINKSNISYEEFLNKE